MKHKMTRFTDKELKFIEENHNLVYNFLHKHGYSIEEYYHIAVDGYLKAVQVYHRRKDLQEKYDFAFISWQYMRAEIGNYFRMENSDKRKATEQILSLDADYCETDSLYNVVISTTVEDNIMEKELLENILDCLSDIQRKIVQSKIDGLSNKEVYIRLDIKPSTYYKEMNRIKSVVTELLA